MILVVSVLCLYFQMSKSNENLHLNLQVGSDHFAELQQRKEVLKLRVVDSSSHDKINTEELQLCI